MDPQVLFGGGIETYLLLFGVLVSVFTIVIFKVSKASWQGLVASFFISILLTALAFYLVNPAYGLTVVFYLAIGFGAIGLLYFSKTWSGFAASVLIGLIVLAMYFYATNPRYGLYIVIGFILLIAVIAFFVLTAFGMKHGYGHRAPDTVTMTLSDPQTGRVLTAKAQRGAFTGPTVNDQSREAPLLEGFVRDVTAFFPDPNERARYIMSQPEYKKLMPYMDDETLDNVLLLQAENKR